METKTITIHKFLCSRCNRKAVSVNKDRALAGICRVCRSQKIVKGQVDIFGGVVA